MRTTKRMVLVTLAVLSLGGPLEAATGGRIVRAAVRLQSAVEARMTDPALRARLSDEAETLVSDLRAARRADRQARGAAYLAALERVRLLDATLTTGVVGPARARLLRAVATLERALTRATRRARNRTPGHGRSAHR